MDKEKSGYLFNILKIISKIDIAYDKQVFWQMKYELTVLAVLIIIVTVILMYHSHDRLQL